MTGVMKMLENLHYPSIFLGVIIATVVLAVGGLLISKHMKNSMVGNPEDILDVSEEDKEKFEKGMEKLKKYAEGKEEEDEGEEED